MAATSVSAEGGKFGWFVELGRLFHDRALRQGKQHRPVELEHFLEIDFERGKQAIGLRGERAAIGLAYEPTYGEHDHVARDRLSSAPAVPKAMSATRRANSVCFMIGEKTVSWDGRCRAGAAAPTRRAWRDT
jgi:hypothetical protein